jgi:hypothetical protein
MNNELEIRKEINRLKTHRIFLDAVCDKIMTIEQIEKIADITWRIELLKYREIIK